MENYYETTICNYFAARRHLCLGRYDGLQGNLPLPPSPFSEEKISRSPRTTTSQVLQIFRWLIATLNNVSNIQPKTPQGAAIPGPCNCAWRISSARVRVLILSPNPGRGHALLHCKCPRSSPEISRRESAR